jgi:hypothetical protein
MHHQCIWCQRWRRKSNPEFWLEQLQILVAW